MGQRFGSWVKKRDFVKYLWVIEVTSKNKSQLNIDIYSLSEGMVTNLYVIILY